MRSGPASRSVAGRFNMPTSTSRWRSGTSGRRSRALPVAFEPPSAGFALDWRTLASLQRRGIRFATITHAAGISSTGDTELDALLPFDEPYDIPVATARAIAEARDNGRRIIAIGTTVVRALEHASDEEGRIRPGLGIATQKVTAATRLKIVDVLLTGVHEPGTSHYELMRAFVDDETLQRASAEMTTLGYHTHEFGDSVLVQTPVHTMARPTATSVRARACRFPSDARPCCGTRRARPSACRAYRARRSGHPPSAGSASLDAPWRGGAR